MFLVFCERSFLKKLRTQCQFDVTGVKVQLTLIGTDQLKSSSFLFQTGTLAKISYTQTYTLNVLRVIP